MNRLSLRARLIASYGFVVFVSLFLAGSGFLWLVQEHQKQREMERLADIVLPLSFNVGYLQAMGLPPIDVEHYLDDQAQQLNVRLFLVRLADRLVVADTANELEGYILPPAEESMPGHAGTLTVGRYQAATGQMVTISLSTARMSRMRGPLSGAPLNPPHAVMVVVPHASLAAAWLALAPRLAIAGALALVASLPVALWLARSIARPLARITRASEEMARGRYDQRIPVEGDDEIGRLATAFNLMARQVALSHRTLREFLADVSHELRTPLTSIRGFSQAMTDGTLRSPADYAEAGQVIHEEAERMGRLVEDLLYLSRVESGQFAGARHPVDLSALASACVLRAERRAADREIDLRLDAQATPAVLGEAHRLEQVLDNLLDNALKHTPPLGQIRVRLRRDPMGAAAEIAVHNTGSVIATEEQAHVFDRFYRGRSNIGVEGTGLGLAIARQIVQMHGGRIGVTSSAEAGTEFTVWLPATAVVAAGSTRAAAVLPPVLVEPEAPVAARS